MNLMSDPDFRNVLNTIVGEIAAALPNVMNNARDTLKKHIDEDVYEAYTPEVYRRRSDNPDMGVSLGAQAYQEPYTKVIPPAGGNVGGKLVITSKLYYNPSGEHKYPIWSSGSGKRPKWVLNLDGNELISRIEKKSPAYNWGQDKVPARPFWQRFVDEMVDGGELEKSFVSAMSGKEKIVADGNVFEDSFDRDY